MGVPRVLRPGAAIVALAAAAALLAGCAAPAGEAYAVRNAAEFALGTDGDGQPDTLLDTDGGPIFVSFGGREWEVLDVVGVDPVLHSTLVTLLLEDPESGEQTTQTFDLLSLPLGATR